MSSGRELRELLEAREREEKDRQSESLQRAKRRSQLHAEVAKQIKDWVEELNAEAGKNIITIAKDNKRSVNSTGSFPTFDSFQIELATGRTFVPVQGQEWNEIRISNRALIKVGDTHSPQMFELKGGTPGKGIPWSREGFARLLATIISESA